MHTDPTMPAETLRPTEHHPFEPFLPKGAHILFLGSFPPQPHRWCMPFYYPNWINDFWRIMGIIHFGDKDHFCIPGEKRFDEKAIRAFCTEKGLAFYDTACEVRRLRDNASDAFLEVVTPTDIPALLRRIPYCHSLVTTGEKASSLVAECFGCAVPPVGGWIDLQPNETPDQVGGDVVRQVHGNVTCYAIDDDPIGGWSGGTPDQVGGDERRHAQKDHDPVDDHVFRHARLDRASLRFWRMPSSSRAYPLPLNKKADVYRRLF